MRLLYSPVPFLVNMCMYTLVLTRVGLLLLLRTPFPMEIVKKD